MELRRRAFLGSLLSVAAVVAAGGWRALHAGDIPRWVRAVRGSLYPGRVVRLKHVDVVKPSQWAG